MVVGCSQIINSKAMAETAENEKQCLLRLKKIPLFEKHITSVFPFNDISPMVFGILAVVCADTLCETLQKK